MRSMRLDGDEGMIDDPLRRYGVSPQIGQAAMNVLDAMAGRDGCDLPSSDIIGKALKVLGADPKDRGVSRNVAPAIVYRVRSASKPRRVHLVALYMEGLLAGKAPGLIEIPPKIIDAECSCEATGVCFHMLVALTYAENDGYHLDTGREEMT